MVERKQVVLTVRRADNNRESIPICDSDNDLGLFSFKELEDFFSSLCLATDGALWASEIKT